MSSVSAARSSDSYEAERTQAKEAHERSIEKLKNDEEKTLASAKEEYQERLKDIKKEANEEVRRMKESSYDSQGRTLSTQERESIAEKKRITDAYEASLSKAEQSRRDLEKSYEKRLDQSLANSSERNESQMQTQKEEFIALSQEQKQEAARMKKYYESELAKEKDRNQKSETGVIQQSNVATEKAIDERSRKYEEYIRENRKNTDQAYKQKNDELLALKNTSDPTQVSQQAKQVIEATYQKKFNGELDEERRVHAANTEALKTRTHNYEQELRDNQARKFQDMSQELRGQLQTEKYVLVKGFNDLEASSSETQKKMQEQQVTQAQRAYQKHANEMSLTQQRNQEQLKEQRLNLLDVNFKDKDELEAKHRVAEREFGYKLNDTRREYEKKLLDQKDLHEQQTAQNKFEFDKKLQEQQRNSQKFLNERIKDYENQLKQQEISFKEHDRLLTEHYEEELDKLKRTNARITQAKS